MGGGGPGVQFNLERGKYRGFSMPVQLDQAVIIKILHTILRINATASPLLLP